MKFIQATNPEYVSALVFSTADHDFGRYIRQAKASRYRCVLVTRRNNTDVVLLDSPDTVEFVSVLLLLLLKYPTVFAAPVTRGLSCFP